MLICSVDVTIFWSWQMMLGQILQGSGLIKMLGSDSKLIMQGKWALYYYVWVAAFKGNAHGFVKWREMWSMEQELCWSQSSPPAWAEQQGGQAALVTQSYKSQLNTDLFCGKQCCARGCSIICQLPCSLWIIVINTLCIVSVHWGHSAATLLAIPRAQCPLHPTSTKTTTDYWNTF